MKKITKLNKLYTLCALSLGSISLTACGGGGGSSAEGTPTTQTKINAAVTLDTPDNVINGEKALYNTQLTAEVATLGMSAEPAQIIKKYFSPQLTTVQANALESNSGCYEGLQLSAGEQCQDHYEVTSTADNASYHGSLIYETTTGTVTTPIDINFKADSDALFNHSDIQVMSVGSFSPGLQTSIDIVNTSQKVLQHPQMVFPESVRAYIHALNSISTLESGQTATLKFELDNSAEALAALKAWKNGLDQALVESLLHVKTNEQKAQKVELTPSFNLSTLSAENSQNNFVPNANGDLEKMITLKNVTTDTINSIDAQFSPVVDGVSADFSLCTLPLAAGASCQVKVIVTPEVSNTGISNFETAVTFVTDSMYHLDDLTTNLAMDTTVMLSIDPLSVLIDHHDSMIKLVNNGNVNFKPSTLTDDYKIYDATGKDISNQMSLLESSSCLTGNVVAPGMSCSVVINPSVAISQVIQPLKLVINNSNTTTEVTLPNYSDNGIFIDATRTPNAFVSGKDASIYVILSPVEAKKLYGFELPFKMPYTLDTSVENSCQIGSIISSPCVAKIDISGVDLANKSLLNHLVIQWDDASTDTETLNINVVDINDPEANISGLVDLNVLSQLSSNTVTVDTEGLHLSLTNNATQALQYLSVAAPQWLSDIVDFQTLDTFVMLGVNQSQSLTLPLLEGKTIADLQQAMMTHQAEVIANNDANATLDKVFGIAANNAATVFYPSITNALYPSFDDGAFTQEVVFTEPGVRYIPMTNNTSVAQVISFEQNLPTGVTLSSQASSPEMTLCEDAMTLASGMTCYVAFHAAANANEQPGNHFNLTLTPSVESGLLATTLQMTFKTNFVNEVSFSAPQAAINVPLTGVKHYDLKIINNEAYVAWLPSTDIANYHLTGETLSGLQLSDPTLIPSCLSGAAVASGAYCYVGLDISDNSTPAEYGLVLDMGDNSNLAQNDLNIGTVNIIDHGIASAELVANGQTITGVVAGLGFDVVIHAPESWFNETTTDQSFTISSSSPEILINGAQSDSCTLSQSAQSLTCQVHVTTTEELAVGSYELTVTANDTMEISNPVISFNIQSYAWKALSKVSTSWDDGSCGIGHDHKAYCWGSVSNWRLGTGGTPLSDHQRRPVAVTQGQMPEDVVLDTIVSSRDTTCALDNNGQAYCWGYNAYGLTGTASSTTMVYEPTKVAQNGITFKSIVGGQFHFCAISTNEELYCWGSNRDNQLATAIPVGTEVDHPVAIPRGDIPVTETIKQVIVSAYETCALASNGWVYCTAEDGPAKLTAIAQGALPQGAYYTKIQSGYDYFCGLASDNHAYCWGYNRYGQLGDGSTTKRTTPVQVKAGVIPANATLQDISANFRSTCLLADNKAYCFGDNQNYDLGNGNRTNTSVPVAVAQGELAADETVKSLAGNNCFISNKDKAYCWGSNRDYKTGTNVTSAYVTTPKVVYPYNN
ncbi:RCC1 domain-containing protein [Cysteiniphilum sp. 6C5]|uniref:RCC1 domain-containing protein n=1 Tax=unclassified Cysteiniphilum TaxID=2610889 RepID=UPI003F833793